MRVSKNLITLISGILTLLLVVGCTNAAEPVPTPTPDLSTSGPSDSVGTPAEEIVGDWIVVSVKDVPVATEVVPTLSLTAEGAASGATGCNTFGGTYTTDGNGIVFAGVTATLVACEDEAMMTQESAMLDALQTTTLYLIDGDTLTFTDDAGTALLVLSRDA